MSVKAESAPPEKRKPMNIAVVDGGGISSRAPGRGVDVSTNRSVTAVERSKNKNYSPLPISLLP